MGEALGFWELSFGFCYRVEASILERKVTSFEGLNSEFLALPQTSIEGHEVPFLVEAAYWPFNGFHVSLLEVIANNGHLIYETRGAGDG